MRYTGLYWNFSRSQWANRPTLPIAGTCAYCMATVAHTPFDGNLTYRIERQIQWKSANAEKTTVYLANCRKPPLSEGTMHLNINIGGEFMPWRAQDSVDWVGRGRYAINTTWDAACHHEDIIIESNVASAQNAFKQRITIHFHIACILLCWELSLRSFRR